ncbi:MAG TPA: hypothetical protein PKC27_05915 [Methanomethylovorans sp.]|nr:hypothetical protein [Methanomethylovorans sp.]
MMTEEKTRDDLHGRINSFDQNLRSLERRLRAVERRLSMEVPPQDLMDDPAHMQADLLQQMRTELAELREQISALDAKAADPRENDINALKQQMEELQAKGTSRQSTSCCTARPMTTCWHLPKQ